MANSAASNPGFEDEVGSSTMAALRIAFWSGIGSSEEEIDSMIADYLVKILIDSEVDDQDAWATLESYLPNTETGDEGKVSLHTLGAFRGRLSARALELRQSAKSNETLPEKASGPIEARSTIEAGREMSGEEGRQAQEVKEREATTEEARDIAFLCDLLGQTGVCEREKVHAKDSGAHICKDERSDAVSGSQSSVAAVPQALSSVLEAPFCPLSLIKFVYFVKSGKDKSRAAETLVMSASSDGIAALKEEEERHARSVVAARAALEKEEMRVKQAIVDRFADQITIHGGSSSSSSSSKRPPMPLPTLPKNVESKLRFREGVVVASKGEKYVVEKLTPDWDGGSRGKVKTKGKRGPGFV